MDKPDRVIEELPGENKILRVVNAAGELWEDSEGSNYVSNISSKSRVSEPTVRKYCQQLEELGYVERRSKSKQDHTYVDLTERGRRLYQRTRFLFTRHPDLDIEDVEKNRKIVGIALAYHQGWLEEDYVRRPMIEATDFPGEGPPPLRFMEKTFGTGDEDPDLFRLTELKPIETEEAKKYWKRNKDVLERFEVNPTTDEIDDDSATIPHRTVDVPAELEEYLELKRFTVAGAPTKDRNAAKN